MKKCSHCGDNKAGFYKNKSKSDGLSDECKKCIKERIHARYISNPTVKENKIKSQKENALENNKYVFEYLKIHPCIDCGESDPIVLEFDHVRGQKLKCVNFMVLHSFSLNKIIKEIEKCEVRCANCHRRKTAKDRNYHRWNKT